MTKSKILAKIKEHRESAGLLSIMAGGDSEYLAGGMVREHLAKARKLERSLKPKKSLK